MRSNLIKILTTFFVLFSINACNTQQSASPAVNSQAELFKLAQINGCIECHRVDATVVGPSWKAIAERYKGSPKDVTRKLLIESTKKGSIGKWVTWKGGDGMPPMEKRVASETIEKLVDYILSLNDSAAQQ